MRIIYADVDVLYPKQPLSGFKVLEIRDQDGVSLKRLIDPSKIYHTTEQVSVDLAGKLGTNRIHVVITPD
jgi:hypothetical protein